MFFMLIKVLTLGLIIGRNKKVGRFSYNRDSDVS